MSDAAPAVKTPKKRVPKPKKPASHPKYSEMIAKAVDALKERGGSSRQAILKYIIANYSVGTNVNAVNARLKSALKAGVKSGSLKQAKGTGAAGSFRLGEKKAPVAKKVKKPKAAGEKKPKAKKPKAKKTGEKKAAKPKKAKSPKAKTAAKPKKPKSPKKPKAAKPKAAKKAKSPKKK